MQNHLEIKKYLEFVDNDVTEVRLFTNERYMKINGHREYVQGVTSGYYDRNHQDNLIRDIEPFDGKASAIYTTIHNCKEDLMGRRFNKLEYALNGKNDAFTKDVDIKELSIFPIDVDSDRSSGVSATDDELEESLAKRDKIAEFFNDNDIVPVKAMSGNGYHLLIPLLHKVPVTDESKELFDRIGHILADYFGCDSTVYNLARIWKLYGTMVCKGDNATEIGRIHRRSKIDIPEQVERYDFNHLCSAIEQLESRRTITSAVKPTPRLTPELKDNNNDSGSHNSADIFISDNNIEVLDTSEGSTMTKHCLLYTSPSPRD